MTRINAGIPPKQLRNDHLLAEHREIKRVPNNIVKRLKAYKQINFGPAQFTMGAGHVNFFNDKLAYLHKRYVEIRDECMARRFKVTSYEDVFFAARKWAPHLYNDWRPKKKDIETILGRLTDKDKTWYSQLSAYKIWKENISDAVTILKASDPELYKHIKAIK